MRLRSLLVWCVLLLSGCVTTSEHITATTTNDKYHFTYIPDTGEYNLILDQEHTQVDLQIDNKIEGTTITGTGIHQLKKGLNQFVLTRNQSGQPTEVIKLNVARTYNAFNSTHLTQLQSQPRVQKGNTLWLGQSRLVEDSGIRRAYLTGTPFEIGFAHGAMFKKEIHDKIALFRHVINLNKDVVSAFKLEQHIPTELIEEMQGIAAGAETEYFHILMMNVYDSINQQGGCAGLAFKDSHNKMIIGRQLDWESPLLYNNMVLLFIKPQRGNAFATFVVPGTISAETAMNEKGLTISLNFLGIDQTSQDVLSGYMLSRQIIQYADSVDQAETFIQAQARYPVRLMMASDPQTSRVFELANETYARIDMEDNIQVVSNHAVKLKSTYTMDSRDRLEGTRYSLKKHQANLSLGTALKQLRSPLLTYSRQRPSNANRQSAIFIPADLNFWIAKVPSPQYKPASHYQFHGFNLLHEIYGTGSTASPKTLPAR